MNGSRGAACATLGQFRQLDPLAARQAEGPFTGLRTGAVDVPLLVRDLSLDGCVIELQFPVVLGRRIGLQINLPGEGWIALKADTLRVRNSSSLAAKFVGLDASTMERLARGIRLALRLRPPSSGG